MSSFEDQGFARVVKFLTAMLAVSAICILAGVAVYFTLGKGGSAPDSRRVAVLQDLAVAAGPAATGDAQALETVVRQTAELKKLVAAPGAKADASLAKTLSSAEALLKVRPAVLAAATAVQDVRAQAPDMLAEINRIQTSVPGAASATTIARPLERFELSLQRIELDLEALLAGTVKPADAARRLAENSDFVALVLKGLKGEDTSLGLPRASGADAERRALALGERQQAIASAVSRAVAAAPSLPVAQTAAREVRTNARVATEVAPASAGGGALGWLPLVLGLAALIPLVLVLLRLQALRKGAERQRIAAEAQGRENERNQQAILRLLDELSSLADGDLTVQATVTEDITGAIADSINYAVEALRGLVTTINQSSIQLDSAARQTQALSQHLAKASVAQSKQIASASESAGAMASNTEEISGNAERASDVARHSVDVAHKGGDAVRRTIDGMNAIRETIQETSKRIKRLGESSQEIGNIVELINDIAEQTNILALNASIQASMAGDAGRGFAVVADEVQRLAERAALSTKQIEVLVRTIQTDTNEAVVSMERSTTDVVGGALLAENAGAALEEIEQVSNQIASLVQNISGSSRQQAQSAQNIARNLQVLREISAQTAESTSANSMAIAKLAELSAGMRKAAAGFRLPGAVDPAASVRDLKRPEFAEQRKATAG